MRLNMYLLAGKLHVYYNLALFPTGLVADKAVDSFCRLVAYKVQPNRN